MDPRLTGWIDRLAASPAASLTFPALAAYAAKLWTEAKPQAGPAQPGNWKAVNDRIQRWLIPDWGDSRPSRIPDLLELAHQRMPELVAELAEMTPDRAELYELELPRGVTWAGRAGPIRLVADYHIEHDSYLLRLDVLFKPSSS